MKKFLKNLSFGEINYYTTQMLSDHEYMYQNYLHKMDKSASSYFLYEEEKIIDDSEYTIFECNIHAGIAIG